jgi:hypothetical protein
VERFASGNLHVSFMIHVQAYLFTVYSGSISCVSLKDIYSVHFLNHSKMMLVASASLHVNAFSVSPFGYELIQSW